jgi:acetylornithine/succinyldiaminopimelate/putrescine aminotransferase
MFEDIHAEGAREYQRFINEGIARRAALAGEPVKLVSARGGKLIDARGGEVEDLHGAQALGHRPAAVTAALQAFLSTDSPSWYPSRVNPFCGRLAQRLCARTGYDSVFFACSGTEASEAALKLARKLTGRPRLLGLQGAYHGCTFGSCALMNPGMFREPFGPHLDGAQTLPFGDVGALQAAFAAFGAEVAAVIVEPVQIEGGVRALPPDYIEALCALTAAHGALLIADEAQTGLGRTGLGFLGTEAWPRRPDAVLLAKTLGGGVVPISAMLTRKALFEAAYGDDPATSESHNATFSNNALGAVAGLAVLDLIDDALIREVRDKGARWRDALRAALADNPLLIEVRGEGLSTGVALAPLSHPWLSFDAFGATALSGQPLIGPLLCHRLYRHGFFAFPCGHDWSTLRLQPRYDITDAELDRFNAACAQELRWIADLT